jgi:hypothetical protein
MIGCLHKKLLVKTKFQENLMDIFLNILKTFKGKIIIRNVNSTKRLHFFTQNEKKHLLHSQKLYIFFLFSFSQNCNSNENDVAP